MRLLHVRIPSECYEALGEMTIRKPETISDLVREALAEYLDRHKNQEENE